MAPILGFAGNSYDQFTFPNYVELRVTDPSLPSTFESILIAKPGPPGIEPYFPPPPFAYIPPQVCCMVQQPEPWSQIDPAPVPEASGYALLGIGLFALALLDRRRRRA